MKKYINRNFFWADVFLAQLKVFGIKHVCISPGSRNTPLTLAFAKNKAFTKYLHVDERSSCFFALGLAKETNKPIVVVTTSGTAVAELYPAIIEAFIQRIPLIICTADRPEYLINTGANQTINQNNIFRNHIRNFVDFGLPGLLRKNILSLCEKTYTAIQIGCETNPGPIHFNFPFKKPLEPNTFSDKIDLKPSDFVKKKSIKIIQNNYRAEIKKIIEYLNYAKNPIIHLGWDQFLTKFYNSLVSFSNNNKIPIFVDGTSELRFHKGSNTTIVTNHSSFLPLLKNHPDLIIQFGNAPTSQNALKYFEETKAKRILINKNGDVKDPSKIKGELIKIDPYYLVLELNKYKIYRAVWKKWFEYIYQQDSTCEENKDIIRNANFGTESRIVMEIISMIPNNSNLFISNSLPVRDFDFFAPKVKNGIKIFTNRGASGIDGIISTASGIAIKSKMQTYLIVGDLAFFHNISALSTLHELRIPLKIILINNNGGGIFNMLPVADGSENFNKYFTTPQNLEYKKIIKALNGKYYLPNSWSSFRKDFLKIINDKSYSVIEVKTSSKKSLEVRRKYWNSLRKSILK